MSAGRIISQDMRSSRGKDVSHRYQVDESIPSGDKPTARKRRNASRGIRRLRNKHKLSIVQSRTSEQLRLKRASQYARIQDGMAHRMDVALDAMSDSERASRRIAMDGI